MSCENHTGEPGLEEDEISELRRKQLDANLTKLKVFYLLRGAGFVVAVFVPFLKGFNLSLFEILLLQALFGVALCILEVPSGYFSDVYGRKKSLIIGSICLTLGFSCYCISEEFLGFLIGELILAVAVSFTSGADTSMTYDTLVELGTKEHFRKVIGNQSFVMGISGGITGCLGSWLLEIMWRLPIYLETACFALMIPLAFSLVEPNRKRLDNKNGIVQGIHEIISETTSLQPLVKRTILLASFVGVGTLSAFWLSQPWQTEAGLPVAAFGVAFAIMRITVAVSNLMAIPAVEKVGYYRLVYLCIGLLGFGFFVAAGFPMLWALPVLLFFGIVRGITMVIFSEKMNHLIPSDRRSTILSLESLIGRLMFVPLAPLLGFLADGFSLKWALLLCASVFPAGIAMLAYLSWRQEVEPAATKPLTGSLVEM